MKQLLNIFPFHLALLLDEYRGASSGSNSNEVEFTIDAVWESHIHDLEVRRDCLVMLCVGSVDAPFSRAVVDPFVEMYSFS